MSAEYVVAINVHRLVPLSIEDKYGEDEIAFFVNDKVILESEDVRPTHLLPAHKESLMSNRLIAQDKITDATAGHTVLLRLVEIDSRKLFKTIATAVSTTVVGSIPVVGEPLKDLVPPLLKGIDDEDKDELGIAALQFRVVGEALEI